jgi:DNA-binding XRE family transcriptional regulator
MSTAPPGLTSSVPGPSSGKGGLPPRYRPDGYPRGRSVREAAGLTKKELAQHAGLSRETVSRIETLKRPAEPATVRALATALEVEPVVLVTQCQGRR